MRRTVFTNDPCHDVYDEMREYLTQYEDMTEEEAWQEVYADIDFNFDEFRDTLKAMNIANFGGKILCLGDLGLWNGRISGYREFDNWEDIVYVANGDIEFYLENGCMKAVDRHHDGTNHYTFYIVKDSADVYSYQEFLGDIVDGKYISPSRLYRYCRSFGRHYQNYIRSH